MKSVKNYFGKWIGLIGELRQYPNTTITILIVSFLTMMCRYHSFGRYLLPKKDMVYLFPVSFLISGMIFFLVPILSTPLLKSRDRFGLRAGNVRTWIVDIVIAWMILAILIFIFGRNRDFLNTYPLFKPAARELKYFLIWEICQLVYMFGWEFIFRGYLLFSIKREVGPVLAVIVQMLPFAFLHIGKPELEVYGSIAAGLFLGMIALRANSFVPCAILHFSVAFTMDLFAIFSKNTLLITR